MEYDSDRGENAAVLSVPSATSPCPARTVLTWKSPMKQPACLMRRKNQAKGRCEHGGESIHSIGRFCHWTGVCAALDKKEGEASSSGLSESEQCDKTCSSSNADLMSVLCKMNSKLDSLNFAVNELTGTVLELKNENACMKKEIERLRKIEEEANRKLKQVQY